MHRPTTVINDISMRCVCDDRMSQISVESYRKKPKYTNGSVFIASHRTTENYFLPPCTLQRFSLFSFYSFSRLFQHQSDKNRFVTGFFRVFLTFISIDIRPLRQPLRYGLTLNFSVSDGKYSVVFKKYTDTCYILARTVGKITLKVTSTKVMDLVPDLNTRPYD